MASIQAMEYQINTIDYRITKPTIDHFLKKSEIPVSRKVKGKFKTINIRPFVDDIIQSDRFLTIHTKLIEGRTVRINEIISQLFIDHRNGSESFPVHKTRQFIKANDSLITPMEIR